MPLIPPRKVWVSAGVAKSRKRNRLEIVRAIPHPFERENARRFRKYRGPEAALTCACCSSKDWTVQLNISIVQIEAAVEKSAAVDRKRGRVTFYIAKRGRHGRFS